MPISELVDYIREQTREGVAAQDIRVELLSAGWLENDIENGLHDVAAGMYPITKGASIHEDLAQVRGMVAHLATRLKGLEATIATFVSSSSTPSLRAQAQLPSAFIGADHELAMRKPPNKVLRTIAFLLDLILSIQFVLYWSNQVEQKSLAIQDFHVIVIASLVMLAISSIILLHRRSIWSATLLAGSALALGATEVILSWQTYQSIGTMVALALLALFVVSAIVFRRWSVRLSHEL